MIKKRDGRSIFCLSMSGNLRLLLLKNPTNYPFSEQSDKMAKKETGSPESKKEFCLSCTLYDDIR